MTSAAGGRSSVTVQPGSFRDPAGFVYERDGVLYRQVDRSFGDDYDQLMASGLYPALVAEGLLVEHEEVDLGLAADPDRAHRVLRPERLSVISYPYEWCPGQLRDAALATLRIQELALEHGMVLRDASAFNVQFRRGRAVHLDTLSLGRYRAGRPWGAYRQFTGHFLAPLALMTYVDARLGQLLRTNIDGIPIDLTSSLLPARTRLRPALLTHVHLQARAERAVAGREDTAQRQREATVSRQAMRGLIDSLRGAVERLTWDPGHTTWSDYYAEAGHYSGDGMAHKEALVASLLECVAPSTVWDLGANTGRFSQLAAANGAEVVAFDADIAAVEAAWRGMRADTTRDARWGDVLPLVQDLTDPSPALGWAGTERMSFLDRGPVDLVLALALIHHLAIAGNVPLDRIAELLARTARHAIVEFVPASDPKVEVLMATREDTFSDYREDRFEEAIERWFDVEQRHVLTDSDRSVYLLRRTATP